MATPTALILSGYGINCEEETRFAFEQAGARADIVHINDMLENPKQLDCYQIVAFPGGFSYGDDTGSGNALAWKVKNSLGIERFIEGDKLIIGICNGFQVLVNLGLLPGIDKNYGERQAALTPNDSARYYCRWVDLEFNQKSQSPWVQSIGTISLPIAHGEGNFYARPEVLQEINTRRLVAARYVEGELCRHFNLPANPNGSLENIAGITDESGKILGLMPHPERAIDFTQLPHWTLLKEQQRRAGIKLQNDGSGIIIFKNGVEYFQ